MAGILRFSDYLGGPDNIQIEEIFPSTQRTYSYNFGQNVAGWTFEIDYQTLIVDPLTWDRHTGQPNFANSNVIGYFAKAEVTIDSNTVNIIDEINGIVNITIPGNLYTGSLIPDARSRVPITIVGITWTTAETPSQTNTHRWAFIQSYEPDVVIGDPTLDVGYTAFTVGA